MPEAKSYTIHLIADDGRVDHSVSIVASADAEAVEQAKLLAVLYEIELREGDRVVARVPRRKDLMI